MCAYLDSIIRRSVDVIKLSINSLNFRHYLFCLSPWPLRKHGMEDMVDTADTGAMEGTGDMVDTDTAAKNERQLQLQSQMLMLMHIMDMVVMEAMEDMEVMEDTEGMVDMDMDARNDLLSPIMVMGAMVVTEVMVAMAVAMEAMVDTDTGVKSRTK